MRTAGLLLAAALGLIGFGIAFGVWSVGYCGGLTPDVARPGTLRHDLCRGTSGDLMSTAVLLAWLLAVAAPLIGLRLALRAGSARSLAVATSLGAVPIATVAVLAEVLPQG